MTTETSESPSPSPTPKRSLLRATLELGPAMQAAVPGIYAWAVTVAPAAFGHGARWYSVVCAIAALLALGAGFAFERPRSNAQPAEAPPRASVHPVVPWAFVLACAGAWAGSPDALSTTRLGSIRGIAGAIGWALFALACAAPPVVTTDVEREARTEAGPKARHPLSRGDAIYVGASAILAFGLQLIGWDVVVPERAILVRLVTLGAGIAIVSVTSTIALARHGKRRSTRPRILWPLVLAALLLGGVLVHLLDR